MAFSEGVRRYDFRRAAAELSLRPLAVIERLGCKARRNGSYWFIQPPAWPDASTFWVAQHDGSWRHEGKNRGGDIIDLIAYCNGVSKLDALKWAYAFLGWGEGTAKARVMSDAELARIDAEARRKQAVIDAERLERGQSFARYWAGLPSAAGTVVETYLTRARGIPMDRLSQFPSVLKFEKRSEYVDEDTGEVTYWPAMVALLAKDGKGGTGIHRTYLRPDGTGKADVSPAKKMFGVKSGASIRLTRGQGGLSVRDALSRGVRCPLVIGEGIETVLSVAAFLPDARCWAAGDIGNMGGYVWPDHASQVVLLRDNDLHPMAVAAFGKVERHWRAESLRVGRRLIVAASDTGSDFNDELR